MPMQANMNVGIRPVERPQAPSSSEGVSRRGDGGSSSGFSPRTEVAIQTAVEDMAGILSKISSRQDDTIEKMPEDLQKIVQNILKQSFSMNETLSKGIGSTLESQRFSMEQLTALSRMLHQLGNLVEKGFSTDFGEDLSALLKNFKSFLVETQGATLEPVLLNKASFELLDTKTLEELPDALKALIAATATVSAPTQTQSGEGSSLNFLKQLVDYFMPKPENTDGAKGETANKGQNSNNANNNANNANANVNGGRQGTNTAANQGTTANTGNAQTNANNPAANANSNTNANANANTNANANANNSGGQANNANNSQNANTGNQTQNNTNAGNQSQNSSASPQSSNNANNTNNANAPANQGQSQGGANNANSNANANANNAPQQNANSLANNANANNFANANANSNSTVTRNAPDNANANNFSNNGESANENGQNFGNANEKPAPTLKESLQNRFIKPNANGVPAEPTEAQQARVALSRVPLQNTPQAMQTLKNTAEYLLKNNANMTEADAELLQNFVNGRETVMTGREARQLQTLLRLCQQNVPTTLQQAAVQQNLPELPRLWAFMTLCDFAVARRMTGRQLKKAGKNVADLVLSMRHSMTGSNREIQGQRSLNFMMPLYMGDEDKSYPSYIHVYDENEQDPYTGEFQKETWLRLCVLTDNIGAVELTCRVYGENELDMRLFFSDHETAEEFREVIPDFLGSLGRPKDLTLNEIKVGAVDERRFL